MSGEQNVRRVSLPEGWMWVDDNTVLGSDGFMYAVVRGTRFLLYGIEIGRDEAGVICAKRRDL